MATDYISREAAIALTDQHCFESGYDAEWMEEELKGIPAANVRPVCKSRWIEIDDYVLCANCGAAEHSPNKNYCHNCGFDMRKVVEIDQVKEGAE